MLCMLFFVMCLLCTSRRNLLDKWKKGTFEQSLRKKIQQQQQYMIAEMPSFDFLVNNTEQSSSGFVDGSIRSSALFIVCDGLFPTYNRWFFWSLFFMVFEYWFPSQRTLNFNCSSRITRKKSVNWIWKANKIVQMKSSATCVGFQWKSRLVRRKRIDMTDGLKYHISVFTAPNWIFYTQLNWATLILCIFVFLFLKQTFLTLLRNKIHSFSKWRILICFGFYVTEKKHIREKKIEKKKRKRWIEKKKRRTKRCKTIITFTKW